MYMHCIGPWHDWCGMSDRYTPNQYISTRLPGAWDFRGGHEECQFGLRLLRRVTPWKFISLNQFWISCILFCLLWHFRGHTTPFNIKGHPSPFFLTSVPTSASVLHPTAPVIPTPPPYHTWETRPQCTETHKSHSCTQTCVFSHGHNQVHHGTSTNTYNTK